MTNIKTYIDLFSGCGGFSLGLGNAGWTGLFAIEKDSMAFETFEHNLIYGKYNHFTWPDWLPRKPMSIQTLLRNYKPELEKLNEKIDLIAGGPPCQGFSMAGQRRSSDPRNKLSDEYIKVVKIVKPKYLVLENVSGFNSAFTDKEGEKSKKPYSEIVKEKLEKIGYTVFHNFIKSERFGVPQQRKRFLMIGIRNDILSSSGNPFNILEDIRQSFLESKNLPLRPITVREAINDLETTKSDSILSYHSGSEQKGFKKLEYTPLQKPTKYQSLMRAGLATEQPNSMRLARHKQDTIEKFKAIKKVARPGVVLSSEEKKILGIKKQAICILDAKTPSKTLTTLPDDLLHYSEPRILTVRESARIQSFPDDFEFKGNYTTGGQSRTKECPRYTQVGNAVPPLLSEAIGNMLSRIETV